ncbi:MULTISPECIES: ABC transporter ATP-binding protein [Actibacterium]|uniref:NitT/TauT family transport system ATP-binding protein n=1 Tax=Actibacterium naphthalenivorans TaxID=1614693 RepID=A0A840CF28_9RHOB|nr:MULTISPECIES: ABC transporter ATP-binding protein [Actibacterium]MBB4023945.1 NitT/TauT family transport system ATP-binding protein [Actibacterium naphthalenivorans]
MNTDTRETVLKVVDLGVSYGETPAIAQLDFEVKRGEFVAILGPSGCGKSSMLNVLSGLMAPTRGRVVVDGDELYLPRSKDPRLGYVFQAHRLLPWRTVRQNLEIVLGASDVPRDTWHARIDEILEILHIAEFKDAWPMRLSGGQRQRVSIARAILVDPSYILMDEPLSTLDEVTARSLRQELTGICQRTGATIVFVTHSIREAVYLADRIIILTRGPAQVFENYIVPLERPRDYDDARIAEVEADIVARVQAPWGLETVKERDVA